METFNGLGFSGELQQPLCHFGCRSWIEDRGRDPGFRADGKSRGERKRDTRITKNISDMLDCQTMIQGKCQEMAPRKTLQKPWRLTCVNCFSGNSWSTTEIVREHIILIESQAFRRRKWKKLSYCLSTSSIRWETGFLLLDGERALLASSNTNCRYDQWHIQDTEYLNQTKQFPHAHLKSTLSPPSGLICFPLL